MTEFLCMSLPKRLIKKTKKNIKDTPQHFYNRLFKYCMYTNIFHNAEFKGHSGQIVWQL